MFQELFPIITHGTRARLHRDLLGFEATYQFPEEGNAAYVGLELGTSQLEIGAGDRIVGGRAAS